MSAGAFGPCSGVLAFIAVTPSKTVSAPSVICLCKTVVVSVASAAAASAAATG